MSTPFRLQVPRRFFEEMTAQARMELPHECCGLLAGKVDARAGAEAAVPVARVLRRFPLVNAAASPTAYFADPRGLIAADKEMRAEGIDLLAIYHSHPTSEPVPSRRDREQSQYPGVVYLIISLQAAPPVMRAWWLTAESHEEAEWEIQA